MVLNGLWLVHRAVRARSRSPCSAIIVLLAVLGVTFHRTVIESRPTAGLDRLLIDGVTGLHLGWVTLATVANIAAWLTSIAPPEWEDAADLWGVIVLVVVGVIGLGIEAASRWRLAPGARPGVGADVARGRPARRRAVERRDRRDGDHRRRS